MDHHGIQSVIFSKDKWTESKAKHWLEKHGHIINFKGKGTDETSESFRFRQMEPLSKRSKKEGYYYVTKHPKGREDKGIAFVMIRAPSDELHSYKKEKREKPRTNEQIGLTDLGDQLSVVKAHGMFNMPMELRSTVGHISDGDPERAHFYKHIGHHPTLETAKLISEDLFSNLVLQNY